MDNPVQILGVDGKPLPPRQGRASMLSGASQTPYDAANLYGAHVEDWNPYLWSPDGEINMYHDRITARARDLVRNDGWATAAVMRTLDNVIGPDFRPISKPDHVALRALTGNKAFDHVWADEFGQQVEANYRAWAHDPGFYCDAERMLPMPGLFQVAFRHKIVDGDGLGQMHYLPQRVSVGRARYATAHQVIDPDLEAQYRLPRGLLDSVWTVESGRGANMLSPKGAMGHFQFMPATAKQYGLTDPNDLQQSATAAARMYSDLLKANGGDLERALAGYNWGQGNLNRAGLGAAPNETRKYIAAVEANMAGSSPTSGGAVPSGAAGAGAPQSMHVTLDMKNVPQGMRAEAKTADGNYLPTRVEYRLDGI